MSEHKRGNEILDTKPTSRGNRPTSHQTVRAAEQVTLTPDQYKRTRLII